ncbi:MAG: hypothetical protein NT053_09045 [Cyanobacteria bacterium]|nr:hypothetical protein [Cyanobacteriota bacterium]
MGADARARRNLAGALAWWRAFGERGYDPLLFDSSGRGGGYHLWVLFAEPAPTAAVSPWQPQPLVSPARHVPHPAPRFAAVERRGMVERFLAGGPWSHRRDAAGDSGAAAARSRRSGGPLRGCSRLAGRVGRPIAFRPRAQRRRP